MATVYLAQDLKHDRRVAIKVLKPELAAMLGAERFVAEIRTTAALQHPHILPLFDSGNTGGFLFYVMPFVEGETLRQKLERETQLGIDDAVRIAREVADALDYAHRHGVIHRDIKPENILLHDGRPIVADFGIALAVSAAAGGRMTETGLSLGTPQYMSPEQATAEKELTNRADIYSLGCVLYEMLTGSPPHTGASSQQIIMRIVTEDAAPVTRLRKAVPPNVSAAVAKSLEKIPADRFESAKAFADALVNPTYTTLRSAAAVASSERRWSRDPRSIGVASVAAIASLALVWALTRPRPVSGPIEYDVGLPDSAAITTEQGTGFAVAPNGDFVVYQAAGGGTSQLWYRSLRGDTVRRIDGTGHGYHPAISPNGSRVAFLRPGAGYEWTLETVSIQGGASVVIGRGSGYADLSWPRDTQLQVVDGGSNELRWFDAAGGPSTMQNIAYCTLPSPWLDATRLLCGGGGVTTAHLVSVGDRVSKWETLWTDTKDSARIVGSHFRLVDGKYLVYLSMDNDLLAARVDVAKRRVGRPVRLIGGIARRDQGAGAYDLSSSGALVYAQGANRAVGNLVAIDEHSVDTLRVGQDAFQLFSLSPDNTRLAAVVSVTDGAELRIYDLTTGERNVWRKHFGLTLPVWNAHGDSLLLGATEALYVGSPDQSTALARVYRRKDAGDIEPYSWEANGRIIVDEWGPGRIVTLDRTTTPPTIVEVAPQAALPRVSPDGHWISYSGIDFDALWLQPLPANGKRYHVAKGEFESTAWLSPTELTMAVKDSGSTTAIDRITIDFSGAQPVFHPRRRWLAMPGFVSTTSQYTLTRDGKVVYLRGSPEHPVTYLHVVPDWVATMKRAVDEANR